MFIQKNVWTREKESADVAINGMISLDRRRAGIYNITIWLIQKEVKI